jgi:hypothetical protein
VRVIGSRSLRGGSPHAPTAQLTRHEILPCCTASFTEQSCDPSRCSVNRSRSAAKGILYRRPAFAGSDGPRRPVIEIDADGVSTEIDRHGKGRSRGAIGSHVEVDLDAPLIAPPGGAVQTRDHEHVELTIGGRVEPYRGTWYWERSQLVSAFTPHQHHDWPGSSGNQVTVRL